MHRHVHACICLHCVIVYVNDVFAIYLNECMAGGPSATVSGSRAGSKRPILLMEIIKQHYLRATCKAPLYEIPYIYIHCIFLRLARRRDDLGALQGAQRVAYRFTNSPINPLTNCHIYIYIYIHIALLIALYTPLLIAAALQGAPKRCLIMPINCSAPIGGLLITALGHSQFVSKENAR